ncbi:hypothetical protein ABZ341_34590 [Streptomyces sp. NPDC006173]|uniref:hypothetical protein n=1 Tax=Streptomyces sp. NPDC006173 TaxID=3155349 RepID=UPI003410FE71
MNKSAAVARSLPDLWNDFLAEVTPRGRIFPTGTPQRMVMEMAADSTAKRREIHPTCVPENLIGVAAVEELQQQADAAHGDSIEFNSHRVSDAPDAAVSYLASPGVLEWCQSTISGRTLKMGRMIFIYYGPGEMSRLHFDTAEDFEFNLLVCLRRVRSDVQKSTRTYFVDGARKVTTYDLAAGQAVWFNGRWTPHGRTPLGEGEQVVLASLGFTSH